MAHESSLGLRGGGLGSPHDAEAELCDCCGENEVSEVLRELDGTRRFMCSDCARSEYGLILYKA